MPLMAESTLGGFFPYAYTIGGILFLTAPAMRQGMVGRRALWAAALPSGRGGGKSGWTARQHQLGSGPIGHSQKMTVAARAMAEKKTVGHRS
jgi:hypothetical protein